MSVHVVERLGHKGDGIADGPIFIPGALPGERVEGEVVDGRMDAPRIIEPSSDRVKAPCRHYSACGGCALMHASDAFVSGWKQDVVQAALSHRGIDIGFRNMHTSPPRARRRAVLHGTRTKKHAMIGLFGRRSQVLTEIPDCMLISARIMAEIDLFRDLVAVGASRRAQVTLTVTDLSGGLDVAVEGGLELDAILRLKLAELVQDSSLIRLIWGGEQIYQSGPADLVFGTARVSPPSGSFLQATPEGEAALVHAMRDAVGAAKRVVDLFSGCGTFALPAAQTAEVLAVEGEAPMLAALDAAWRATPGLRQVTTQTRDLFRRPLLPDELNKFDAVIIDPPRAGALAQTEALVESTVPVIGFVSCNPVTFARDARVLLDAGYALEWMDIVDQFRWSTHIEIAAKFVR